MRAFLPALALVMAISGCGSSAGSATSTSTPQPTLETSPTLRATPRPTLGRTIVMSAPYRAFLTSMCGALRRRDSATLRNELPYYQYNSGLRYGPLGNTEGTGGDPALLAAWLNGGSVRCTLVTPDVAGHGTVLAGVWGGAPSSWSLIEMDTFNGAWKINDFTFGPRSALVTAMRNTAEPTLVYRG